MRLLFIGDIVGSPGVNMVRKAVPLLITHEKIDVVIALAMAAYATVQGHAESSYNLAAFSDGDMDWQSLRTNLYVRSGGRIILPGGYHY